MSIEARVRGMTCQGCEEVVESAVELADGVEAVDADRYDNVVTVEGDVDAEVVSEKIELAGYRVESAGTAPTEPEDDADGSVVVDEAIDEEFEADAAAGGMDDATADEGEVEPDAAAAIEEDEEVEEELEEIAEDLEDVDEA